jgi:hypothetical protein
MVLLLGELAGAAALLVKGAGNGLAIGAHGGTRTVVLRVDGVALTNAACIPPGACSQVTYLTPAGSETYRGPRLPVTRTVQVPAGGIVTLNASSEVYSPITCSITVNGGRVLSRATTSGNPGNGGQAGAGENKAGCHGTVPSGVTSSTAVTRAVALRVDGGHAGCNPPNSCGPQVGYRTPAGGAVHFSTIMPFVKTVAVQAGGIVTLDANSATQNWATCTITVNGTVISRATTRKSFGNAICQSAIP